jgi:hypothetical protein
MLRASRWLPALVALFCALSLSTASASTTADDRSLLRADAVAGSILGDRTGVHSWRRWIPSWPYLLAPDEAEVPSVVPRGVVPDLAPQPWRDVHVRAQPVFSMLEPLPPRLQPLAFDAPRVALGSSALVLPRALFYFDPPAAINMAAIQPVPEPGVVAMLVAGLVVLCAVVRSQRRVASRDGELVSS